jgi:hypothetical protein
LSSGPRAFLRGLVVFRPVVTRSERAALLRVADQLSVELGFGGSDEPPGGKSGLEGQPAAMADSIDPDDEQLVIEMRRALANLATAVGDGTNQEAPKDAVDAALDTAEMVMRGEIAMGNAVRLPALLPGLVFLVSLPLVSQDRALAISNRCAQLVEQLLR